MDWSWSHCKPCFSPPFEQSSHKYNDDWTDYELSVSDWRLVEGAVQLFKPVRDTVKALEAEKEPTMHRMIERIYILHSQIDDSF